MTFDAIGFGALNLDKLYKVNMIAREEEEAYILDFKEAPGGSAANTIVGLARLDLNTGFIGSVAEDHEGKLLRDDFRREGVDTGGIIVVGERKKRSGIVMGYVDSKGERALYVDPGVNNAIEFKEINIDYVGNTKFLHLTAFVGARSFETQKELLSQLSEVKISFDPGALYARKGMKALMPIIKASYIMFPNEGEIKQLTGKNYRKGSEILMEQGVRIVAVKLGGKGCYVTDGREEHLVEPFEKQLVDTTGAGDAFCAGFLYGLLHKRDLYQCGRLGNFIAARCIEKMGARPGLPRRSDLKDLETP